MQRITKVITCFSNRTEEKHVGVHTLSSGVHAPQTATPTPQRRKPRQPANNAIALYERLFVVNSLGSPPDSPPSLTPPPMPMPGDDLTPSRQGHGGFLALRVGEASHPGLGFEHWCASYSNWRCPSPISTDGGQTWTDACWGRLELLPPDRRPYILRCRRCSALYREEHVSQFPRRQGARLGQAPCGGRVRSLSCHL